MLMESTRSTKYLYCDKRTLLVREMASSNRTLRSVEAFPLNYRTSNLICSLDRARNLYGYLLLDICRPVRSLESHNLPEI